jgi:hypothetical protein
MALRDKKSKLRFRSWKDESDDFRRSEAILEINS